MSTQGLLLLGSESFHFGDQSLICLWGICGSRLNWYELIAWHQTWRNSHSSADKSSHNWSIYRKYTDVSILKTGFWTLFGEQATGGLVSTTDLITPSCQLLTRRSYWHRVPRLNVWPSFGGLTRTSFPADLLGDQAVVAQSHHHPWRIIYHHVL